MILYVQIFLFDLVVKNFLSFSYFFFLFEIFVFLFRRCLVNIFFLLI